LNLLELNKIVVMKFFIIVLCLCQVSCNFVISGNEKDVSSLYKKMKEGDLKSYHELKIAYLDYKPEMFIPIAKYAADSLRYAPANLDVFESYYDKYYFDYDSVDKVDLYKMSKNDRTEALYYLSKAVNYNDTLANHYKSLLKSR
jgi:hypothetical protein